MTSEQPEVHYRVRPLFHNAGFELRSIDTPLTLPETVIAVIRDKNLPIRVNPESDLRIISTMEGKELYIEAKKASFGIDSSNCEQARAHLLAVGPAAAYHFKPITNVLLSYHLPSDQCAEMRTCLTGLTEELKTHGLLPGASATCGFGTDGANICYHPDEATATFLKIPYEAQTIVINTDPETDPAPLLLVLVDEDHHDKDRIGIYRQAVIRQIHAAMLCRLHATGDLTVQLTAHDLVMETSNGSLCYLPAKRQGRIETMVVENVFKRIREVWNEKRPETVKLDGRAISFTFESDASREDFLDWFEDFGKTKFPDKAPPPDAPLLPGFDEV
jgi:hypothetical protein